MNENNRMMKRRLLVIVAVASMMSMSCVAVTSVCSSEVDADVSRTNSLAVSEAEISVAEFRQALMDAGYDASIYSDEQLEIALNGFANKNLIGKYAWNDPAGVNWLLDKAGIAGTVSEITLVGSGVVIVANGVAYVLTAQLLAFGPVGWIAAAGAFVLSVYTSTMQGNAVEKANVALGLIAQQKNYAVYETTVLWNLMANGYEVEEW